jgi:hypothetical protein
VAGGTKAVRFSWLHYRSVAIFLILPFLLGSQQPAGRLVEFPEELTEETVRRLMEWVEATEVAQPHSSLRNLFGKDNVAASKSPVIAPPPTEKPTAQTGPVLKGFVYTREAQDQPLAAIDFEGQMFLAAVGDTVGPYCVERVEGGDRVLLVEETTGEKLELVLN